MKDKDEAKTIHRRKMLKMGVKGKRPNVPEIKLHFSKIWDAAAAVKVIYC